MKKRNRSRRRTRRSEAETVGRSFEMLHEDVEQSGWLDDAVAEFETEWERNNGFREYVLGMISVTLSLEKDMPGMGMWPRGAVAGIMGATLLRSLFEALRSLEQWEPRTKRHGEETNAGAPVTGAETQAAVATIYREMRRLADANTLDHEVREIARSLDTEAEFRTGCKELAEHIGRVRRHHPDVAAGELLMTILKAGLEAWESALGLLDSMGTGR